MKLESKLIIIIVMLITLSTLVGQTSSPVTQTDDNTQPLYELIPNDQSVESYGASLWHDDCSDIGIFDGRGDDSWPHNSDVTVTFGSISSSGTYYYCNDIGTGIGHHGPLYYHTFDTPFNLSQFNKLAADIEIDGSSASLTGWIRIGLHDPYNRTILTLQVADPWVSLSATYGQLVYRFENGTTVETLQTYPDYTNPEPCRETFTIMKDASGLYTALPGMTNSSLLDIDQLENDRLVKYISIQFNGYSTWPMCETMRIHDIVLEYNATSNDEISFVPSFPYRMYHELSGSPGAGTDYQVEIKIHSGEGINSGNLVNLPSTVWTPSDPVRFTDNDGITLLDYWKEWSDSDDAIYWVEVKDNLDYDTGIFLYFGNSSVSSLSNGTNTFLFFDDFENNNLNRWGYVDPEWETTTADVRYGTYSAHFDGVSTGWMNAELPSAQSGIMIHSWYKPQSYLRGGFYHLYTSAQGRTEVMTARDNYWQYWDGSLYTKYNDTVISTLSHWDRCELGIDLTKYQMMLWVNRTYVGAADHIYALNGNNITQTDLIYQVELSGQSNYQHWADDYYIRKWIQAEPTHGEWNDATPPGIDAPSDIQYNEGTTGHVITWNPSDLFPYSYAIYLDGISVKSGSWNSSSESISISVDGLSLGTHVYKFVVSDIDGNIAYDEVSGIVVDGTAPTIDSPIDFQYNEFSTSNSIIWHPNDLHPLGYSIYLNGASIKSGAWNSSSESISISVDGLSLGMYNYTIIVSDIGGNTAHDEVFVTVIDGTAPTIDSPIDFQSNELSTGNSIIWHPEDLHPASYIIYLDGVPVKSNAWNNSLESISVSVEGLDLGTYNYTILVSDVGGNTARDEVFVTVVDGTAPTIDSPIDFQYNEFSTGNSITWFPGDLHPASYIIYLDGTPVKSNAWNSSLESISVSVDGLELGTYNYTIIVYDNAANNVRDVVFVTVVDGTNPTVDGPIDFQYNEFSTGNSITWFPDDLHPISYSIYFDGTLVKSGFWNSSSESISISIDGHGIGMYNYSIIVSDIGGNTARDEVFVTVVDATYPTVDSPEDIVYAEFSTGHSIIWHPSDANPQSYSIYKDSVLIKSGLWNSSSEILTILVDGLDLGSYNFTVIVVDVDNNIGIDEVFVTVFDGTDPTISTPPDIQYDEFSTGHAITWLPSDLHPSMYIIYVQDALVKTGAWNSSSESITIIVDGKLLGSYNYSILVFDVGSNFVMDTVFVTVIDGTSPIINAPGDIEYNETTTGHMISWIPSDQHPHSYVIYLDGTLIKSGAWNSSLESIVISVEGHGPGIFNYTIVVSDVDGNMADDEVFVTVFDAVSPTIDSPADIEYTEFSAGYSITWHPLDLNPQSYFICKDNILIRSGLWNSSSETISISVDGLSLGVYNYTILVNDVDENSMSDQVIVTVIDGDTPTINTPPDIQYDEFNAGYSITWIPNDLHPQSYNIYLNSSLFKSGSWNSSSDTIMISVDGLALGGYNYTITAIDIGNNIVMDTVFVTVVDGTTPEIDSPSDVEYAEGDTGNQIEWHPIDLHPLEYEILRNGESILIEAWENSSEPIIISVDGLTQGTYNFMLIVTDVGGNTALDTVIVTVTAAPVTTSSTSTTNPTTTNSTQPEFPNFLIIISVGAGGTIIIVIIVIIINSKKGHHGK